MLCLSTPGHFSGTANSVDRHFLAPSPWLVERHGSHAELRRLRLILSLRMIAAAAFRPVGRTAQSEHPFRGVDTAAYGDRHHAGELGITADFDT